MAKKTGTAGEFVMQLLRQYPGNECSIADLFDACGGKFTKENLHNALTRLLEKGLVARTVEGRSAWWAISAEGLKAAA
jgi:DNA-binding IclR family transcriptional regulator